MTGDYTPKLGVAISQEQKDRLERLLPWGTKRAMFTTVIDDLIEMLEADTEGIVRGGLTTKRLQFTVRVRETSDETS